MECFKCGARGDKVRLFDAILDEGIVKVCENCSFNEDIPIIKRPTTEQLRTAESNTPVRQMLMKMNSGRVAMEEKYNKDKKRLEKQEISLRDLVERKYNTPKRSVPRPDLVDNFHWVIMRARRSKKVSYRQLAEAISESEAAVQMAENGILPEDDNKLVKKLESYLNIRLVKDFFIKEPERRGVFRTTEVSRPAPERVSVKAPVEPKRPLPARVPPKFDALTAKTLTISDLQEIKRKKEMKEKVPEKKAPEEEYSEDLEFEDESGDDSGEITKEEMDKILYGK